jgi:hypothetical protein
MRGFNDVGGGREAATDLYDMGADVVLAMAGNSNQGVIEAAWERSRVTGDHLWAIGSDSDWSLQVDEDLRPHVLASAVRNWDVAIYDTIKTFTAGKLTPGVVSLGLADDAIGLAPSSNLTDAQLGRIAELVAELPTGAPIPIAPTGPLSPPHEHEVAETVTVTWDGSRCTYSGPIKVPGPLPTVRIDFVNLDSVYRRFNASVEGGGILLSTLAKPGTSNTGYVTVASSIELSCEQDTRIYATESYHSDIAGDIVVGYS